jgi:hypothetical protein
MSRGFSELVNLRALAEFSTDRGSLAKPSVLDTLSARVISTFTFIGETTMFVGRFWHIAGAEQEIKGI